MEVRGTQNSMMEDVKYYTYELCRLTCQVDTLQVGRHSTEKIKGNKSEKHSYEIKWT